MTEQQDEYAMNLSSGIAAFETKSFTQAKMFLAPLAEEGNAEAQYRMAIMAQNGLGMVENPLMAYKYMKAAAESGLGLAIHGLGLRGAAYPRMRKRVGSGIAKPASTSFEILLIRHNTALKFRLKMLIYFL